jgi:hypothetical protein
MTALCFSIRNGHFFIVHLHPKHSHPQYNQLLERDNKLNISTRHEALLIFGEEIGVSKPPPEARLV